VSIRRAIPVVRSTRLGESREFWVDFLGFVPAMDDPGFLMLKSPTVDTTQVILVAEGAADEKVRDVDVSVEVDDVESAFEEAQRRGLTVVYPLTDEPWGIRRFFVRDPDGLVVNVASHRAPGEKRP
jgi:catechol 2,3-dioxygenase-like lactoylglutathione lyase family enzyme